MWVGFFFYFDEIEMVFLGFFNEVFCCPCLPMPSKKSAMFAFMSCYSCPKCYFKADCFVLLCLLVTLSHQLPFIRSGSGLSPGRPASDWCLGLQMFMHLSSSECFQSSSLGLVQMENTMSSESSMLE